jgi:hypothetical protein
MSPLLIVILVGLFYILVIGGMSLIRQEGLSVQFALESLAIVGLAVLVGLASGTTIDPIVLFVLLYLVTMRSRLLTDLANLFSGRQGYAMAERLYRLGLGLYPDRVGRYVVLVNWGIARLHSGDAAGAVEKLSDVLRTAADTGGMAPKYEAACRYNLGVAQRRLGNETQATIEFNKVVDTFPASIYGEAAERALDKRRKGGSPDAVE